MSHENQKSPKPESRRRRAGRAVLKGLGALAAKPRDTRKEEEAMAFSTLHTSRVALELRKRHDALSLGKGRQTEFRDNVTQRLPLAERQLRDGSREGLTYLIFAGDSVMGVTRILDAGNRLKSARLMLLPLGKQAFTPKDERNTSPYTLLSQDVESARVPRAHGIVQNGEAIEINPQRIERAFGIPDTRIADQQALIGLTADGEVLIRDASSANGTEILTMDTLFGKDLQGPALESAQRIVEELKVSPHLWLSPSSTQHTT
jgi:hypothetical protein